LQAKGLKNIGKSINCASVMPRADKLVRGIND
jgi:hypothetical protein